MLDGDEISKIRKQLVALTDKGNPSIPFSRFLGVMQAIGIGTRLLPSLPLSMPRDFPSLPVSMPRDFPSLPFNMTRKSIAPPS